MSTNYPSTVDSFPTPGAYLSTNPHSALHQNVQDAVTALETKLGVDNSLVTTSIDYLLKSSSSVNPGHKHTVSSISASGTASTGTFLRGDGTWSTVIPRFGGDGSSISDGLSDGNGDVILTAGTTTSSLANVAYVVKNYRNFSITNTGKLAFSNPAAAGTLLHIKLTGNLTLTSSQAPMFDFSGMGAAGGTAGSASSSSDGTVGTAGGATFGFAAGGAGSLGSTNGISGALGGAALVPVILQNLSGKIIKYVIGAGGGGTGGSASAAGVAGSRGGGAVIFEVAGTINFTTAGGISVAGIAGVNGNGTTGGSGAGGGGSCIIIYNSSTAVSGTVTSTGGAASTGGATSGASSAGAGGGASISAGSTGTNGRNSGTSPTGNGGAGGDGYSLIVKNTEFV